MIKLLFKIAFILVIGGLGGVLMEHVFLPYLAHTQPFANWPWLNQLASLTTVINNTQQVYINNNQALAKAIKELKPSVLAIEAAEERRIGQAPVVISQGTGFALTADGLILTALDLVPERADFIYVRQDNNVWEAEVIKRDYELGLALIRAQPSGFRVVSWAENEPELGESVFLLALDSQGEQPIYFINIGLVKRCDGRVLQTDIVEPNQMANGSPLFSLEQKVLGINLVDDKGNVRLVPAAKLEQMVNEALAVLN